MTEHAKIVAKIVSHLKRLLARGERIWWLKVHGHGRQRRAVPDILVCLEGRFVTLEAKTPGDDPTPLQQYEMTRIAYARGKCYVVESLDEAKKALKEAMQ